MPRNVQGIVSGVIPTSQQYDAPPYPCFSTHCPVSVCRIIGRRDLSRRRAHQRGHVPLQIVEIIIEIRPVDHPDPGPLAVIEEPRHRVPGLFRKDLAPVQKIFGRRSVHRLFRPDPFVVAGIREGVPVPLFGTILCYQPQLYSPKVCWWSTPWIVCRDTKRVIEEAYVLLELFCSAVQSFSSII